MNIKEEIKKHKLSDIELVHKIQKLMIKVEIMREEKEEKGTGYFSPFFVLSPKTVLKRKKRGQATFPPFSFYHQKQF